MGYVYKKKMQDYHDMLTHIFSKFKSTYKNDGTKITIDLKYEMGYWVNMLIPVIQFIIGDCKPNDFLW